jgi:hypothetical protein
MRLIGGVSSDKDWNSRIVAQLGFIKKHLRYPLDRNTLWPTIMVAATLPGAGILVFIMLAVKANSNYGKYWFVPILALAMLVPAVVSGRRYLQTLRFIAVPAARTLAENMLLLQRFLLHNHFAFTRHPEAPEVFQIISKSIESLKYEREVLSIVTLLIIALYPRLVRLMERRWPGCWVIGSGIIPEMLRAPGFNLFKIPIDACDC